MQTLQTKLQIPANTAIQQLNVSNDILAILNTSTEALKKPCDALILQINNQNELNHFFPVIFEYINPQTIVWIIYPKQAGNIKTDLTRDIGWDVLKLFNYRGIRLISVNSDFSAMRVKPNDLVKKQPATEYPEIDRNKKLVKLPADVLNHPNFQLGYKPSFNQLSFTAKKEFVLGILSAKREDTRNRRIEKLIAFLAKHSA